MEALLQTIFELSECDKVTGEDCFVARLHPRSVERLDFVLERISQRAEMHSAIVKAQVLPRRLPGF